jgi:uncharacterized protein YndB with AHSA1/START domain
VTSATIATAQLATEMRQPIPGSEITKGGIMTTEYIKPPIVKAEMLIRRPVSEVFAAFVDQGVTKGFWFTKSSGILQAGKEIRWDWEMYGVFAQVYVKDIERNKRILIEWDNPPYPVEWLFTPHTDDMTLVTISTWGFHGSDDEVVAKAIDSKGGFTIVLAGLKALLEHGIALNLVADQHPGAPMDRGA